MRIWMLATGAAALAITAPALADRGGHGGGHGGGNNAGAQQVQRGGGHQKASRSGGDGGQVRVEQRGGGQGGGHFRMAQSESRGHGQRVERAQAKEMLRQAEHAASEEARASLLGLADHWHRLAQQAENPHW